MNEAIEEIIMSINRLSKRVDLLEEYACQHSIHYIKIRDEMEVIQRKLGFLTAWKDKVRRVNAERQERDSEDNI